MMSEEKKKEVLDNFGRHVIFMARTCRLYTDEVLEIIKNYLNEAREN